MSYSKDSPKDQLLSVIFWGLEKSLLIRNRDQVAMGLLDASSPLSDKSSNRLVVLYPGLCNLKVNTIWVVRVEQRVGGYWKGKDVSKVSSGKLLDLKLWSGICDSNNLE